MKFWEAMREVEENGYAVFNPQTGNNYNKDHNGQLVNSRTKVPVIVAAMLTDDWVLSKDEPKLKKKPKTITQKKEDKPVNPVYKEVKEFNLRFSIYNSKQPRRSRSRKS